MSAYANPRWKSHWHLRPDTVYLNHGSFGPPPECVRETRLAWQKRLDEQPMDFFVRQFEPAWCQARSSLAQFIGARPDDLVFVENATFGMNVVAQSITLSPGDEVLLTDHEYGAVQRIWKRACDAVGGTLRTATLPLPLTSIPSVVDAIDSQITSRTRLLVISHITSATAVTLPVQPICEMAQQRGVLCCVDGPHAIAQIPLAVEALGCEFYTASCHKWLSAPFGSGFLWVHPRQQSSIKPPLLSWGRLLPHQPASWSDEFRWSGTRDPSAYLAVPRAIEFLETVGLEHFRTWCHGLAQEARRRLVDLTGLEPIVPDDPQWYGTMAHVPLPPGDGPELQQALWQRFGIEVPIVTWSDRRWIRVSCHLYNDIGDLDRLITALRQLL